MLALKRQKPRPFLKMRDPEKQAASVAERLFLESENSTPHSYSGTFSAYFSRCLSLILGLIHPADILFYLTRIYFFREADFDQAHP
jgi:hypothetical protein